MTQSLYGYLAGFSMLLLSLTLFNPSTLVFFALTMYFLCKFLRAVILRYLKYEGLINFLPEKIRNVLLYRSLFDLLCDLWFVQSVNILKIFFKPFFIPVDPEHASESLNELSPQLKAKFLTKGIVRILPEDIQRPLIGQRQLQLLQQQPNSIQLNTSLETLHKVQYKSTDISDEGRMMPLFRQTPITLRRKFLLSPEDSCGQKSSSNQNHHHLIPKAKWDRLEHYSPAHSFGKNKGVFGMFKDSLQLVKSLLEIKNVSEQVQRISVMKVAKLVILFWLLIILQVKLNAKARKVVFKTLFIIAGIISVFGALGTTGILVYNCVHYEPIEPPKRQIDEDNKSENQLSLLYE